MATDNDSSGSGTDALAGFDYQIDVSIWLALELVLASRLTDAIELEPASEEDIEANLADDEPGPVVSQADFVAAGQPYRMVVQAKLRSGDPWGVADVNRLLEHGKRRTPVVERLKDPRVRYLLVTSAALSGGAKSLRTNSLTVWPQAALPATTAALLPVNAAGRLAVLSNHEPRWVVDRIKQQLTESLRVPFALWEGCLQALRAGAGSRVRRIGTNVWTRGDLEDIVVRHEGYLTSTPELDDFVAPFNWDSLRAQVDERHAALIIGKSGTGKTLATDKLFDELRAGTPGLRRVRIRTPEEMRQYSLPGPVMFDIEDPWGRYSLENSGRGWVAELPGFMAGARLDRIVVATSRLDVGSEAKALEKLSPWLFPLEPEHYGIRERRSLFSRKMERLKQTPLRQLALANIQPVLKALDTPLQIQKFFDALRVTEVAAARTNPSSVIRRCIDSAHEESIEANIALQIDARHDVKAATVLWGILLDRQSASFEDILILEDAFYRCDGTMENGVTPLAHFLVAARNLRQTDNLLTIYHPRDESGLLKAIQAKPLPARATLARLVELLATEKLGDGKVHVERAAILLDACRGAAKLPLNLRVEAQSAIDRWLSEVIAVPGRDLERQLRLAASVGSEESVEGEIARWLEHRPRGRQFAFMLDWGAPRRSRKWRDWIRAAPATRPLLKRFIREVLPTSRDSYGPSFVRGSKLLAGNVTPAFIDGAYRAVEYGILRSEGTIFRGAFADLDGCARVVDHAVAILTPSAAEEGSWAQNWLAIANNEFSPGYMESLGDDDGGFTARSFLDSYTIELRTKRGWPALRDHPQVNALLEHWLRHLRRPGNPPSVEELGGLWPLVAGREEEPDYWALAKEHWSQSIRSALVERVELGSPAVDTRRAAAACLLEHSQSSLSGIVHRLLEASAEGRLADLSLEIGRQSARPPGVEELDPVNALPEPFRTIAEVNRLDGCDRGPLRDDRAVEIAGLHAESEQFRSFRIDVAREAPATALREDVTWILANTRDVSTAVSAVECAIDRDWTDIVRATLQHRFAKAAAAAMRALAPPAPAPLAPELFAMAERGGRAVHKELVELIKARPSPENVATLLKLAGDRYSNADTHDEDNSLPIASSAVCVLNQYVLPDQSMLERLREIAVETDDFTLRREILASLAARGEAGQRLLLEIVLSDQKPGIRVAAVNAMTAVATQLNDAVVADISSEVILRLHPRLSAQLTLIIAWRGQQEQVEALTNALSSTPKRRVFLALLAAGRLHGHAAEATLIAAHLPEGHFARRWALGENVEKPDDEVLNDLGSVAAVSEVLPFVAHRNAQSAQLRNDEGRNG